MLAFDRERVLTNVRKATTEDLLDRVTAYRAGMEPEAVELIEEELRSRGVSADEVEALAERCRRRGVLLPDGTVARCSFCLRPAVSEGRGWHRVWGVLPLFPRRLRYCTEHLPASRMDPDADVDAGL
jgi:hypothetical protein